MVRRKMRRQTMYSAVRTRPETRRLRKRKKAEMSFVRKPDSRWRNGSMGGREEAGRNGRDVGFFSTNGSISSSEEVSLLERQLDS